MSGFDLVVPVAPAPDAVANVATRKVGRGDITIGVYDNGKGNADHLLKSVIEGLKALMPQARFITGRKLAIGPMAAADVERFVSEADVVISAIGD